MMYCAGFLQKTYHKVVRVLPDIDTQNRHQSGCGEEGVLICGTCHNQSLADFIVTQPSYGINVSNSSDI